MRLGLRWFEKGVWQLPHPHRYRRGYDCIFRVHHGVEKCLQICFRIPPDMDDLVARRRIVLARIHYPNEFMKNVVSEKSYNKTK